MESFDLIIQKLEGFVRRFYLNELIKGVILFTAFGLLYLLTTLFVEYVFWLDPMWRTALFWCFVLVEAVLFGRLIVWPLAKLFRLRRGISYAQASRLIGSHFSEVNDQLVNVLQLSQSKIQSDLLMASIDQKSKKLQSIPFKAAIDLSANLKYTRYAAVPLGIIIITFVTGNQHWFSKSYERVVNYKTAYEPPAPFQFFVINEPLEAIENKPFLLEVRTVGDVIPETAQLRYNGEIYFLQPKGNGEFQFVFSQLSEDLIFELTANNVKSSPYQLNVLKTPSLEYLEMNLSYPRHTGKADETVKSSGNAVVPEGTKINWKVRTRATSEVKIYSKDTIVFAQDEIDEYTAEKQLLSNYDYELVSSNVSLKDYERLSYNLRVVKDAYPELSVEHKVDSLDQQSLYFFGQASDDYGLKSLNIVYYKASEPNNEKRLPVSITKGNYSEFITAFPNQLELEAGVAYELYFELSDNDRLNGFKTSKSGVFTFRKRTLDEEQNQRLNQQSQTIKNMDDTFKRLEEQDNRLEDFSKVQKEKETLNFNDKKKFESFLKRQKQQEDLMKNFNKNLQDNLKEFNKNEQEPFKEELEKRLKDNEEQLENNEKLLDELEKIKDKISKEEFSQKLEQLAKQNKNQKRSMKQILELTKRYYVANKAIKIQGALEELAKQQEQLSTENDKNTSEAQIKLNKQFSEIRNDLDELKRENSQLQKPMAVPKDKITEERVEKDQQEATKQLVDKERKDFDDEDADTGLEDSPEKEPRENPIKKAQQKQKGAAQKIKKMSDNLKKMQESSGGMGGGEQMAEDAEVLRQILDNLILFSFNEEQLMERFKSIGIDNNQYGKYIVEQSTLRTHFEHVDDSLFALSLRQPKLSENVNKQISEVYFNIDKALTQLSENRLYQGVSYQQYTITAANELASFLSDMLDNMEQQLNMSPGGGGGQGEQLQDIIISQEELNAMMKEAMEKSQGDQEGQKEGEKGQDGEQGESEQEGQKEGGQGKEGRADKERGSREGQNAQQGSGGDGGQNAENGNNGEGKNSEKNTDNNGYGKGGLEEMNKELYEIYQRQQQLRQALENKVQDFNGDTQKEIKNLIEKMEAVELDLINSGFTYPTMQKMLELQHRLLKLENATFLQGEEERRESKTNFRMFDGPENRINQAKEYFNRTESLNRQALPLKDAYKKKVQDYFKTNDDQLQL